ncbi:MAG: endonuclease/exonuclease/phosphatase family protein [Deltaproteobacteria bacterium]|nr:endonuclease/exonuclease/phosphatase family protein [Deltaproteobacteria bacterium]
MRIATWNVNGIRAREAQLAEWLAAVQPDLALLQELKARPDQVPALLAAPADYWACWHGGGPYSGVALLVRRSLSAGPPAFFHPPFDFENRIVAAEVDGATVASVYVPNGGKDYAAKLRFLEALAGWGAELQAAGRPLLLGGDLNVARTDLDVFEKERDPEAIGQRPDERALLERLLGTGLADLHRGLHPGEAGLFTWWPPWRNMKQRNLGWRIDYLLAASPYRATACQAAREFGTSDHAPLVAEITR